MNETQRKVLLTALSILGFMLQCKPSDIGSTLKPGRDVVTITDNGSWTWYGDPRAVYCRFNKEKTYAAWITNTGCAVVGSYDHATDAIETYILDRNAGDDDHNHPSITMRADRRILAFYCGHNGTSMHMRVTRNPEDVSEWGPDVEILKMEGSSYTYPNVCQLSDENNRLYLFYRGIDWQPTFSTSSDGGKSWSREIKLYQGADRPYCKFDSNGRDRIHIVIENGHRNEPHPSFYLCYKRGGFYRANGTRIKTMRRVHEGPILPREAEMVYDEKNPRITSHPDLRNQRGSVWDVASDESGNPVFVFDVIINTGSGWQHIYYYYRWDGAIWKRRELVNSGAGMGGEYGFAGGITLDHGNPDILYMSRQIKNVFEIEKWETRDTGNTWRRTSITTDSGKDNTRPCVPRGSKHGKAALLWLYGEYASYDNGKFHHYVLAYSARQKASGSTPK